MTCLPNDTHVSAGRLLASIAQSAAVPQLRGSSGIQQRYPLRAALLCLRTLGCLLARTPCMSASPPAQWCSYRNVFSGSRHNERRGCTGRTNSSPQKRLGLRLAAASVLSLQRITPPAPFPSDAQQPQAVLDAALPQPGHRHCSVHFAATAEGTKPERNHFFVNQIEAMLMILHADLNQTELHAHVGRFEHLGQVVG